MDVQELIQQIESAMGETPEGVPIFQVRRRELEGDAYYIEKITRYAGVIERFAPRKSIYHKMCARILDMHAPASNSRETAERLRAVLIALKDDLTERTMQSTEEMIHGDLLSDFLEMAMRLVIDGFKDPSAVLAGSVLAEQLRRLCAKYDVVIHCLHDGKLIPKNLDQMNHDLYEADVYTKADMQNVEAWNTLRLSALHGRHNEYTAEEVRVVITGIRDFMARNPA